MAKEKHDQQPSDSPAELPSEELGKANACCEDIRRKAADHVKRLREQSVGDVVDGTLDFVRRHPGSGIITAVLSGFFLGRLFRR